MSLVHHILFLLAHQGTDEFRFTSLDVDPGVNAGSCFVVRCLAVLQKLVNGDPVRGHPQYSFEIYR